MKTILNILFFSLLCLSFAHAKENLSLGNEVKEYDKIFEKIAEKRVGINGLIVEKLTNPFIISTNELDSSDKNASNGESEHVLEATMNQKAKINGLWYNIQDTINTWKLVKINHNSAILQNETEKKEIFIRTKDESNIKIFSK